MQKHKSLISYHGTVIKITRINFSHSYMEVFGKLGFPRSSTIKNPHAMQETRVLSLGQEDPLQKEMATHSSILAWKIPWMEEPGGLQSMGLQRVRHN